MGEPLVLPSAVQKVDVFRSGAVVTRRAELAVKSWPDEVALEGLPLSLDDESVRVRLTGAAGVRLPRPTDVRVSFVVPKIGEPLIPPSERELLQASDEVDRLESQLSRIEQELGQLGTIGLTLPEPFENRPPKPVPSAAWSGVLDWTQKAKRARIEQKAKVGDDLKRAREALAKLERRDAEARARKDTREDLVRKRVVLRLRDAGAVAPATLELEYQIAGARWVPTYVFRMGRDGRTASLAVRAMVVQRSGEPWERVKLACSTADLVRETAIPKLESRRIGRRQPEPPNRAWREPPTGSELLFEGLDRALSTLRPPPPPAPPPMEAPPEPPPPPMPEPAQTSTPASGMDDFSVELSAEVPADLERSDRSERNKPAPHRAMPKPVRAPMAPTAQAAPAPVMAAVSKSIAAPGGGGRAVGGMNAPVRGAAVVRPPSGEAGRMRSSDAPYAADEKAPAEYDEVEAERGESAPEVLTLDPARMRYSDLVMAGWDDRGHARGKLRPITLLDRLTGIESSAAPVVVRSLTTAQRDAQASAGRPLPAETVEVGSSSGAYDYRYEAEGPVDVPTDGTFHGVPLFLRTAPVTTTLVVVPRESTQAVRVAAMKNPLDAPLLAGPAEIYLEDEFLVTSPIRTVPAGAELKVGLGIEEGLKVARNAHFEEQKAGLLGGGATLDHRIEIEVASKLSAPVKVEVRERVPVKDSLDKEIEIVVPEPTPPWEAFDQRDTSLIEGGKRWLFGLAPGESKKLSFGYQIKIDGKNEVVGGNRRE